MFTVSAVITAAGKNSRMRKDQLSRNLELKNKLILPFEGKFLLLLSSLSKVCVAIFVLISVILYKDLMFTINGLLLILNSLCFAITATSLAYLIGCLIKNENVISGIQNVISLGLSFISGCFVPIEWLDTNIINFSKIFPSYWFIQGNYDITKISTFNFETIQPVIQNCGIILAFGIIYFSISKVIIAKKSKTNM